MCGKFAAGEMTQAEMLAIMEQFLYGTPQPVSHPHSFRPTDDIWLIKKAGTDWQAHQARWWLIPHWFKRELKDWKATTFNARIETAFEKPVYRDAWKHGRCLIPAIAYSEFTGAKSPKQEWQLRPKINHSWFFIAGLYTTWKGIETCTMLTREARPEIKEIHHRQPVILNMAEVEAWLSGDDVSGDSYEMDFEVIDRSK